MTRSTEEVLHHYLDAVSRLDHVAQLADYANDAVFISELGPVVGKEAIAASNATFFAGQPHFWYETLNEWIHGDLAMYTWKGRSDVATFPIGVQSFLIRDGHIQRHTFWCALEPK